MTKITQNFYQAKANKAVHRWLTTLCLIAVLWVGAVGQVNAQTWLTSAASYNSGDGLGYTVSGTGTFYRGTSGGTSTITTDTGSGCNGSTQTIQMNGSLFIFKATADLNGIVLYGNSGTGSSRTFSAVATASTLNGTYTAVAGTSAATGNLSGTQATNFCSPSPMTITFGSTIPAGTYFRISLSGNAYIAAIQFTNACTPATINGNATTSIGSTTTLTTTPPGAGAWSSSNTNIATVNASGVVTGVSVGTATITYTLSGCPATKDIAVVGDAKYFRSKANGVWSAAGTWEASDDGSTGWAAAANAPDANAKGIEIAAGTIVTLGANLTTPLPTVNNIIQVNGTLAVASTFKLTLGGDMLVNSTGSLTLTGATAGSLITNGKVLTVLGTLSNSATVNNAITVATAAELVFATAGGAGVYELTGAGTTPQVPRATWVNGVNYSKILFTTSANITSVYNDTSAVLGNVEFNTTNAGLNRVFGSVNGTALTMHNLTITSAGTGGIQLTGGATTATFTLTGSYSQAAGSVAIAYANANITLNVAGNFSLASGTTFTSTGGVGTVVFNGNTLQAFNNTGATMNSGIDYRFNGVSVTPDASLTAKTITVNSGALTVKSGTNLTVQNAVVNNAGVNGIVVENNANLIQVSNAVNTGAVTVKRNSNALYRLDYTMWSSPVSGTQTLANFSPLTSQSPNRFYTYNSSNNKYGEVAPTGTFEQGKGYLIRMPNEDPAADYNTGGAAISYPGIFTGVPNNGTVSLTSLTAGQYVAVGNPYPSTISANAFINANTDSAGNGVLYFWRKTNNLNQAGSPTTSYATYTLAGGVGTGAPNGGFTPGTDIQVGQGFITTVPSSGTITFTNAMRSSNNSAQFLRTKASVEKDRVWLNLSAGTNPVNQMLVAYMDGATSGVDAGIDGKYINDSALALTSNINGEEYVIQGRPAFDASDVVPLNFKTDTAGDYTIAIDHADGVFATGQDVFLVDTVAGTETSLKSGSYTFTAPAGTANSRFSLKYQKTLGVNDAVFNENNVAVYTNKGVMYVNSGAVAIANVKVYDIQGKLLAELKEVKAVSASVNLKAANQVLVVKVTAEDGGVVTKKVVN